MAMTIDPETGQFVPVQIGGQAGIIGGGPSGRIPFDPGGGAYGMMAGKGAGLRPGEIYAPKQLPTGVPDYRKTLQTQLAGLLRPALKGPTSLPGYRTPSFLSPGQLRQRGARAGTLGPRQGPVFGGKPAFTPVQRAGLRPGQSLASQIRQMTAGGRFGNRARTSRDLFRNFLRQGSFGAGGGAGRQPLSFGILGRPAGRLGQRIR